MFIDNIPQSDQGRDVKLSIRLLVAGLTFTLATDIGRFSAVKI